MFFRRFGSFNFRHDMGMFNWVIAPHLGFAKSAIATRDQNGPSDSTLEKLQSDEFDGSKAFAKVLDFLTKAQDLRTLEGSFLLQALGAEKADLNPRYLETIARIRPQLVVLNNHNKLGQCVKSTNRLKAPQKSANYFSLTDLYTALGCVSDLRWLMKVYQPYFGDYLESMKSKGSIKGKESVESEFYNAPTSLAASLVELNSLGVLYIFEAEFLEDSTLDPASFAKLVFFPINFELNLIFGHVLQYNSYLSFDAAYLQSDFLVAANQWADVAGAPKMNLTNRLEQVTDKTQSLAIKVNAINKLLQGIDVVGKSIEYSRAAPASRERLNAIVALLPDFIADFYSTAKENEIVIMSKLNKLMPFFILEVDLP